MFYECKYQSVIQYRSLSQYLHSLSLRTKKYIIMILMIQIFIFVTCVNDDILIFYYDVDFILLQSTKTVNSQGNF